MNRNTIFVIGVAVIIAFAFFAGTGKSIAKKEDNSMVATHMVEIVVKDYGTIKAELYGEVAPVTVDNFVKLVGEGFYDGLTFHRIIDGFMIQGGDPDR